LALYHAKTNGRNRYELFNDSMLMNTSKHFNLQATLSGAKDRGELLLHYQPILSLATGDLAGFEALMRWQHPDNGIIYPLDFIPVAEETGLINEIGAWGVREACKQLKTWQEAISSSEHWFMSVNVSGRQLESESFANDIKKTLASTGVNSENLVIELTENILMHDIDNIAPRLFQLKELGLRLAIDDFGTGYSSLAVLHDFPFDILKVAREFVTNIHSRQKASRIVKLIHLLAKQTNLQTIVEGIETEEELNAFQHIGCDLAQGFLFSKPKDAKTLTPLLLADPKKAFTTLFKFRKKTA
jgi:EAL domain-containing protein (putative c-di-GMP-specific phosphodiesterase class I)